MILRRAIVNGDVKARVYDFVFLSVTCRFIDIYRKYAIRLVRFSLDYPPG